MILFMHVSKALVLAREVGAGNMWSCDRKGIEQHLIRKRKVKQINSTILAIHIKREPVGRRTKAAKASCWVKKSGEVDAIARTSDR